ncbi:N-myristoyl transferase [Nemania abortiva]|nr:N-myristoyl transferase [Nemania abortiva]
MADYKFWKGQPVPQFNEAAGDNDEEGPLVEISPDAISREPVTLLEGYVWSDIDLQDSVQLHELYELLDKHYVEDDELMFRFQYPPACLQWALQPPGWKPSWHVGIREGDSRRLVACITAVPMTLRVRNQVLSAAMVNFLCVHQTLRCKRLTPVLVREITRRCTLDGLSQAVYTSGSVLPRPFSTARYYHRSLNPAKLADVGFSSVPPRSTIEKEAERLAVPDETVTPNLRPMAAADVPAVHALLTKYLARYDVAPIFREDEIQHHFLFKPLDQDTGQPVLQTHVVEDAEKQIITDLVSFWVMPTTVLDHKTYESIDIAWCGYYASAAAWDEGGDLKARLVALLGDALILAKKAGCDVFNALTTADSPLFLNEAELKFRPGDGMLNWYLYNYRTAFVPGGLDADNRPDEHMSRGIGIVGI